MYRELDGVKIGEDETADASQRREMRTETRKSKAYLQSGVHTPKSDENVKTLALSIYFHICKYYLVYLILYLSNRLLIFLSSNLNKQFFEQIFFKK